MSADKNIRLIGLFTVFTNMSFVIAVIVPYYRDAMGIGFREFLIGEAVFAAIVVLLEVPTGWISDVWKRKHVLAIGAVLDMIGYFMILIGDSFWWAIAGQAVIGIAISFLSGTHSSMLYDSLLSAGREKEFRKREGKRQGLQFYSIAGASVASGFLYAIDMHLPAMLSVLVLLGALLAACAMDEPVRHKRAPEKNPFADMAKTANYALRGHAEIGFIILFAAGLFCATKMIMWSQQPYYMALGLHEGWFGVLMAAGFLLAGVSSHVGHLLDGKARNIRVLASVWLAAVAVCVGAGLHLGLHGVALLMIGGSCLYGIAGPRVAEAIHNRVGSERRATILSTQNLMVNLAFIPVSTVVGLVSDSHGINGALFAIAAWLIIAGVFLGGLLLKKERRRKMMLL